MNPAEILAKLGLAEGAAPEAIVEALIKYLAGPDAPEAKSATVMGLLSMLAPAPAQPSSETPAEPVEGKAAPVEPGKDPEAMRAAMEALDSENRALHARMAEMEASMKRAVDEKPATPAPEKTPEERAATLCGDGQWPMDSRAALVEQLKAGKTPYLWAKGHFTSRSARFTAGGNPKPNFGTDDKAPTKVQSDVKGMFKLVERNVKTITGAARPTVQ